MTQAVEILTELQKRGVTVRVDGETLFLKPKSAIDHHLLTRIRESKLAILAALALPAVEPTECKHCDGSEECNCPACTLRRTEEAVPCLICHPQERQVWLAATRPTECWFCEERRLHGEVGLCMNCAAKPAALQ